MTVICGVFGFTPAGSYAGIKRPNSRRLADDDRFAQMIRRIFEQHRGNYGAPRIIEELRALGQRLNRKQVERRMREMGLRAKQKRKFRAHTTVVDPDAMISPNLLKQDFTAEAPNQRWVGDITYLKTTQSMSKTGGCYDNAVVESFFHSPKVEWIHGHDLRDREIVRSEVFRYIEGYFIRSCRHSTLGYLSPAEFEQRALAAA